MRKATITKIPTFTTPEPFKALLEGGGIIEGDAKGISKYTGPEYIRTN
jgi:hypothetical protein